MLYFQIVKTNCVKNIIGALFLHDNIICGRYYGLAENEHSLNSILLITLYVKYSNGNGLFSSTHTSAHGIGKFDNRMRSPASRMVGLVSG